MILYLAPKYLDVATQDCDFGNKMVVSLGDNVLIRVAANSMQASHDTYEKPQGELIINLVTIKRRKAVETPSPKGQVVRKWYFYFTILILVARPGNSEFLRVSLKSVQRNVVSPNNLRSENCVGRGGWKKRMQDCNGIDRAVSKETMNYRVQRYSLRKKADFQLVMTIRKLVNRLYWWRC